MSEKYLLGVDIGTTSVKTMIVNMKGQELTQARHEHRVFHPHPDWAEEKPEEWWEGFKISSKKAASHAGINLKDIVGIGISNLCTSLVILSAHGKPVYPAIIWNDRRSLEQANNINILLNNIFFGKRWLQLLGRIESGEISITSIQWLIEKHPQVMDHAWKFVHANGYLGYRLTGRATMDASNASRTGLFDMETLSWDESIASSLGVNDLLPDYCRSYEVIGNVTHQAAIETGLTKGITVVAGGADTPCAALGAGVISQGQVLETTGGTGVLSTPFFEPRQGVRCSIIPGQWMGEGETSGTGLSLQWMRDHMGFAEISKFSKPPRDPYKLMDELASESPLGAKGLMFLPYLGGKRSKPPNIVAKGAFIGLTFSHNSGDLVRAVLEGTAFELCEILEQIENMGVRVLEIRSVGGGAKSDIWNQLKADIFGRPLLFPSVNESSSFGAAMLAAIGVGLFKDYKEAVSAWVRLKPECNEPNPGRHEQYAELLSMFKELYKKLYK